MYTPLPASTGHCDGLLTELPIVNKINDKLDKVDRKIRSQQ